jgi:hypothetical protein
MTVAELKAKFPHISESTLRLNAGPSDSLPVMPKPRRRTIKAILEAEHGIAPIKAEETPAVQTTACPSLTLFVPVLTVSENNRASHEHWRVRQKRAKAQRAMIRAAFAPLQYPRIKPALIRLERLSPRSLDHSDNLPSAFKAIRDELAIILGFNDRDETVMWTYFQRKPQGPRGVAIHIAWDKNLAIL